MMPGMNSRQRRSKKKQLIERDTDENGNLWCNLCKGILNPKRSSLDHILPVCHGGGNHIGNLQLTHTICNHEKGCGTMEGKIK